MTGLNASINCQSCSGAGWKYTLARTAVRAIGRGPERTRDFERRSCLDCAVSGRAATC
ncbi:hypothetical protein [Micromonospora sp. NPDC050276]|uniref:hypothetical protein n=1 Tax=Micromonospora sp. NPDC050276 TaxID=3364278 RepID=UPI00378E2D10